MVTVTSWLLTATKILKNAKINSARLDAELLLSIVLRVDRVQLLTKVQDKILPKIKLELANTLLQRRLSREPLAYIRGFVEFYGLEIQVTPQVLIPRPETEALVEQAIKLAPKNNSLVDVGTGSGAIALAIKANRPDLKVYASDISSSALKIAKQNASHLMLDIDFTRADILDHKNSLSKETPWKEVGTVVANLPYVRVDDERSPETDYEPKQALFAKENGLQFYKKLLKQLPKSCKLLIVESNPDQVNDIKLLVKEQGFEYHKATDFISVFKLP